MFKPTTLFLLAEVTASENWYKPSFSSPQTYKGIPSDVQNTWLNIDS